MSLLESLKPFATAITLIIVAAILFVFRRDVSRLVGWIVTFRRVAKTKDGYSLETGNEPEVPVQPTAEEAEKLASESDVVVSGSSAGSGSDTWYRALDEKRYDDAIRILQELESTKEDLEFKLLTRSIIAHVTFEKDAKAGLEQFESLLRSHSTNAEPYIWLALTYKWRNLIEKALVVLDRGLSSVNAPHARARLLETKSGVLRDRGDLDDAIRVATTGTSTEPRHVPNFTALADLYVKKGDKASAREWYLRALEASEGDEGVLADYAKFLEENEFPAEALLRRMDLVNRDRSNPTYLTLLGNVELSNGLNNLAFVSYQEASRLASDGQGWILANIGNLLKNQGFYTEGLKYLERA